MVDNKTLVVVKNLHCEYKTNPLGIDMQQPRLSWQLVAQERGVAQTAYQVQVAESLEALDTQDLLWDSGKVVSGESIHHPYEGPSLTSGQRCYWQVRIWEGQDSPSEWSQAAFWEMGLLAPADWQATWIQPDL